MKKLKVLFITNYLTPYRLPFYNKLFNSKDFEWLLLSSSNNNEYEFINFSNQINFPHSNVKYYEFKLGPYVIRYQKGIIQYIFRFKPDVIILLGISGTISNWTVLILCKFLNIKTILWTCGWEAQSDNYFLKIKHFFLRNYFKLADKIILYSTKAYQYLISIDIRKSKLIIAFNGLEIEELIKNGTSILLEAEKLKKNENLENSKIFLYVGGLSERKRVKLLLDSFKYVQSENCVLWIIGNGLERKNLEKHAYDIGLNNVKFWGRIVNDVDKYFAAADFFILPGIGGLALNQAMFWEVPCIVSEADGTEDDLVIDKTTGLRFISGNVNSLSAAIEYALNLGKEIYKQWAERSRELILKQSNVDLMVEKFLSTLKELI